MREGTTRRWQLAPEPMNADRRRAPARPKRPDPAGAECSPGRRLGVVAAAALALVVAVAVPAGAATYLADGFEDTDAGFLRWDKVSVAAGNQLGGSDAQAFQGRASVRVGYITQVDGGLPDAEDGGPVYPPAAAFLEKTLVAAGPDGGDAGSGTVFVRMYLRVPSGDAPAAGAIVNLAAATQDTDAGQKARVVLVLVGTAGDPRLELLVQDSAGGSTPLVGPAIAPDRWHYLEAGVESKAVNGKAWLYANVAAPVAQTTTNTGGFTYHTVQIGLAGGTLARPTSWFLDEVEIADGRIGPVCTAPTLPGCPPPDAGADGGPQDAGADGGTDGGAGPGIDAGASFELVVRSRIRARVNDRVALDAAGSTGTPALRFAWRAVAYPAGHEPAIDGPNTAKAWFIPAVAGDYAFRVVLVDAANRSGEAFVHAEITNGQGCGCASGGTAPAALFFALAAAARRARRGPAGNEIGRLRWGRLKLPVRRPTL